MIVYVKGGEAMIDEQDLPLFQTCGWWLDANGYLISNSGLFHNFILPDKEGYEVDHIDRNPANNQRSNLRYLTHSQNGHNRDIQTNNRSGTKGVHWSQRHRRWQAYINIDGKRIHLGWHKKYNDALLARENAEKQYGVAHLV